MERFKINATGQEFEAANVRAAKGIARGMGVKTYYGFSYFCPVSLNWVPADQLP